MMRAAILAVLGGLLLSAYAAAAVDIHQFSSVAQEQQYRELIGELRCPKCQNTSIADSNAVIAGDMRDKVYHLMLQGQSKQQIIDYIVARYGRFVTYTPPLNPLTLLLWLVPLLFVAGGATIVIASAARRKPAISALSSAQQQRLARLIPPADRDAL
ncbi:cytochrome c-type biogenesis protein [Sodalis praecaptivus]|uniref:cytochrome c-type biogenesis protein n=1 Tax=Sodalis praecaptivus TaxID=1239307 RepID=UPI00280BC6EE|nr:cytochrome c-type biogenesis protein CcmH [Sodalis praecaptivus]